MSPGGNDSESGVVVDLAAEAPPDWPALVASAPEADYAHTRHWHDTVCDHRPGSRQVWLTARRAGRLLGGMGAVLGPAPGRLGSLFHVQRLDSSIDGNSGGPLLQPDLPPAERAALFATLVNSFLARRPGGLATAAMALNPASEKEFGALLTGYGPWRRQDSPTAMVSLAGGIEVVARERLVMNKRNERNRGLKRGAEVFASHDADLLAAYYPIYERASAHWGVPATPLGLLRDLLADPLGRVFFTCVRLEGQVIGGHLCLHLGERVFAWNGVTDPAFARSHFPATLCFWGDMVEACRRGAQWLDFGASGGIQSLSGFKRYFGAEMFPRGFYVADTAALRFLRRMAGQWRGVRQGAASRWHDGAGGHTAQGGGSA